MRLAQSAFTARLRFVTSRRSWQKAVSICTTAQRFSSDINVKDIRNIGIVAHIDAGKTTLTERILHLTNSLTLPGLKPPELQTQSTAPGDVDTGSTVTDFLEEERQRGITIQSAAVGPVWWKRRSKDDLPSVAAITLVDTPGHVDFGIEVERTVRVVDGTVVVLDAVEGVEPQSANVWNQTMRYGVRAHLFFINKLDREGASIAKSIRSIVDRGLHSKPVLLQLPAYASQVGEQAKFAQGAHEDPIVGVVDLLSKTFIRFEGVSGHNLQSIPLNQEKHAQLYGEVCKARESLVETVSTLDIELLEQVLELEDSSQDAIPIDAVQRALRRLTLAGEIAPVLCGAAARNIGVQPLLDAVALYLPSPNDRQEVEGRIMPGTPNERSTTVALTDPEPTALAFKVVYDKRRGPVTFVRVYSGAIRTASTMFNTTTQNKERITRLMLPYADQFVEVPSLQAGQIGVVLGLRDTRTGDTLIDTRNSNRKQVARDGMRTLRLRRVHVPPPVFSVSVEPRSKAEEGAVTEALQMLVRTDPSLHVNEGSTSLSSGASQTVLSGMGELHLEIAKHRLRDEFQVDAHLGQVRVGYRETLDASTREHGAQHTELLEHNFNGKRAKAGMTLHVQGTRDDHSDKNLVMVDLGDQPDQLYDTLPLSRILEQGATAALARGPLSGFPLQGLHITMSNIQTFGPDVSTPAVLRMLVAVCLRKLLAPSQDNGMGRTVMMEPMMRVSIEANEMYAGKLSTDITVEQHGSIVELVRDANVVQEAQSEYQVYIPHHTEEEFAQKSSGNAMLIVANIPLARMTRYSTRLRALTGGAGVYQMELEGFSTVTLERQKELLQELGRSPRP